MELKGKERQFFKKEAHALKPIFQIGKGGLSEEMIHQIQNPTVFTNVFPEN